MACLPFPLIPTNHLIICQVDPHLVGTLTIPLNMCYYSDLHIPITSYYISISPKLWLIFVFTAKRHSYDDSSSCYKKRNVKRVLVVKGTVRNDIGH